MRCRIDTAAQHALGLVILLLTPTVARAQAPAFTPSVSLGGELRLRGEWDGRTVGAGDDAAVLSRARLNITAGLTPQIAAFLQLQDARAWGTETNTASDGSADQIDLHQGYADVRALGATWRLGRQELALGDERLVGAVGWSNTGRAFDGVQMIGGRGPTQFRIFWMNVAERDSVGATGLSPQRNEGASTDGWMFGGFVAHRLERATLEATFAGDRRGLSAREIYTVSARAFGAVSQVSYDASAAYQFGPDRGAWMASAQLGTKLGQGSGAIQIDWLSGQTTAGDPQIGAFHTLYPTNHKFYGYMDYFLAFPGQTQNAGLIDGIVRITVPLRDQFRLRADGHYFATAKPRGGERYLGLEGDLVATRTLAGGAAVELGASVFAPGDLSGALLPAFAAGTDEPTYWGYAQLTVRFP